MAKGHFTGFGDNLLEEDMVVQISMGAITDRTEEHLSSSDVAIVQARALLLQALKNDAEGRQPLAPHEARFHAADAMPIETQVPPDTEWRKALTRQPVR